MPTTSLNRRRKFRDGTISDEKLDALLASGGPDYMPRHYADDVREFDRACRDASRAFIDDIINATEDSGGG